MAAVKKVKKEKTRNKKKTQVEEPEISLQKIPTFEPRVFKETKDLNGLKPGKLMDIKFYKDNVHFYKQGKNSVKLSIPYDKLDSLESVTESPELIRLIVNTKNKKTCHQIGIADEESKEKVLNLLKEKKEGKSQAPPASTTKSINEDLTHSADKSPKTSQLEPAKAESNAASGLSKNTSSVTNLRFRKSMSREPSEESLPTIISEPFETPNKRQHSKPVMQARSQPNFTKVDTRQDEDDFNSSRDQVSRNISQSFIAPKRPDSFYNTKSQISYDSRNVDYVTDGWSDYDSEYSEETIVVRPVKPRSLNYYTPFVRVKKEIGFYY